MKKKSYFSYQIMIKSKLMIYRLYLQCDMNANDRMPCKHHFMVTDFYLVNCNWSHIQVMIERHGMYNDQSNCDKLYTSIILKWQPFVFCFQSSINKDDSLCIFCSGTRHIKRYKNHIKISRQPYTTIYIGSSNASLFV